MKKKIKITIKDLDDIEKIVLWDIEKSEAEFKTEKTIQQELFIFSSQHPEWKDLLEFKLYWDIWHSEKIKYILEDLCRLNLIVEVEGTYYLTKEGWNISHQIKEDFYMDDER